MFVRSLAYPLFAVVLANRRLYFPECLTAALVIETDGLIPAGRIEESEFDFHWQTAQQSVALERSVYGLLPSGQKNRYRSR
ncbi:hypothetical protein BA177_15555 [Woeseia oceani]|uniref:Uncharacterized protein n=1 Tax=Woeseia oceani TaxID=1548547 RepID=A0A193LIZ3_9GAMM|nr:hypothetical protein BA177_15555 [Woeseia oceani]